MSHDLTSEEGPTKTSTRVTRVVSSIALLAIAVGHSLLPSHVSLDWPTIAVLAAAAFLFNAPELRKFLPFIKSLEVAGAKVELREKAQIFAETVDRTEAEADDEKKEGPWPALAEGAIELDELRERRLLDKSVELLIVDLAARDKVSALLRLGIEIEKEVQALYGVLGLRNQDKSRGVRNVRQMVSGLLVHRAIPPEMAESLTQFWQLRNNIAHSQLKVADSDPAIVGSLESGLRLLGLIKAIPRPTYRVIDVEVPLFRDAEGKQRIDGAAGVILEATNPDGTTLRAIYPAGRRFVIGEVVAWDWDMTKGFGETFYRNPRTDKIELAWSNAAIFRGETIES